MGSVGIVGVDESHQPSGSNSKKYKLPRKLLDECGGVNYGSVPRKQRSAIKKRGRESITPPLPILKEQQHVSGGVATLRKRAKKSKLNKKRGHITKDEKEVAETLYALADMFSDATKNDKPELAGEPSEDKSSNKPEASMTATEDTGILEVREGCKKISVGGTSEVASRSPNFVDLAAQVVKFKPLDDAHQSELPFSKQSDPHSSSGVQSGLNLGSRENVLTYDMTPSGERSIAPEQVAAPRIQYGKQCFYKENGNFGLYQSPNFSPSELTSKTRGSSLLFPAWLKSSNCTSQPRAIETSVAADKYPQVVESKESWKRCSAHVYISRLTKVLQISKRNEDLLEKPTQALNGRSGMESFNGIACSAAEKNSFEMQNAILLHKRLLQDQQSASKTSMACSSTEQGSDFLSLGGRVRDMDASAGIRTAGYSHEALRNYHMTYLQSQNQATMPFSLPQNGYSASFQGGTSAVAAQQVRLPPHLSTTVDSSAMAALGQQQKWIPPQYSSGGGVATTQHLADWQSGGSGSSSSLLNYAQTLFPHLNSALGAKYQQFSSQQQQFMAMNSSLPVSNVTRNQLQERWFFATPTNLS